uniref:Uncharacterized protein n=1 Tax=Trichinella nativa TaxID=6335 RepID=A0A0V1KJJ5_9BILA
MGCGFAMPLEDVTYVRGKTYMLDGVQASYDLESSKG